MADSSWFDLFKERLKRPYVGAFILSWIAINWKIIILLFFSGDNKFYSSCTRIPKEEITKIKYIELYLAENPWNSILLPICYAFVGIFILSVLNLGYVLIKEIADSYMDKLYASFEKDSRITNLFFKTHLERSRKLNSILELNKTSILEATNEVLSVLCYDVTNIEARKKSYVNGTEAIGYLKKNPKAIGILTSLSQSIGIYQFVRIEYESELNKLLNYNFIEEDVSNSGHYRATQNGMKEYILYKMLAD